MNLKFSADKLERIKARYQGQIIGVQETDVDVPVIIVSKKNILDFLKSIRIEEGFEYSFLSDLTAIDENPPSDSIPDYGLGTVLPEKKGEPRFFVVYQLLSMQYRDRIRVKVPLMDGEDIPSVTSIWKGANWLEREVYDMYGIKFSGHPNLIRILLDQRWIGHPQRKDYPIKRYQRFEGSSTMETAGFEE